MEHYPMGNGFLLKTVLAGRQAIEFMMVIEPLATICRKQLEFMATIGFQSRHETPYIMWGTHKHTYTHARNRFLKATASDAIIQD